MMKNLRARRVWFAAALLFFVAFPALPVGAKLLEVYDLDSLVHLSTDVVEAEILRNDRVQAEVTVTLVHKGELKVGQQVAVADCDLYQKSARDSLNSLPLAAGDRLVFFLVRANAADDRPTCRPLPGGMRLVAGDRLHVFSQWNNPGPYVAGLPLNGGADESPTVEQFRQRIRDSLRDTREWADLIEAKQDQRDVEGLMKLLATRSGRTDGSRDHFSERMCVGFAESHDLAILKRALPLADHRGRAILQRGFGTPAGRDWLLAKVADAHEPMPARLLYAYALRGAGEIYRSTITEISATSWRPEGDADEGNSGYLTRIAKSARELGQHEELCRSLLECLDWFGQSIVQNKPAPLMADLRGAFAELAEFHRMHPSEELQFAIEQATAWDPGAYEKLNAACGPLISILRPADPAQHGKPVKGRLTFQYQYSTVRMSRDAEMNPALVLIHETSRRRHVVPTKLRIAGWSTGGGCDSITLPENLPAGRYQVHLEVDEPAGIKSKGHFFVAEL